MKLISLIKRNVLFCSMTEKRRSRRQHRMHLCVLSKLIGNECQQRNCNITLIRLLFMLPILWGLAACASSNESMQNSRQFLSPHTQPDGLSNARPHALSNAQPHAKSHMPSQAGRDVLLAVADLPAPLAAQAGDERPIAVD